MVAQSFQGLINPLDLQSGKQLIDGATIAALVKQNNTGVTSQVALAGGGYAGATPVNYYITEFTTVASANDSCVLPLALSGIEVTVINSGAQNLRIYCNNANPNNLNAAGSPIADTIIALAGGAGVTYVTLPAAGFAVFSCSGVGRWKSQNV